MNRKTVYGALALAAVLGCAALAQDVGFSTNVMPLPATVASPGEVIAGQIGTALRYAREDHTHPRLSRTLTVTTAAGGTFSGTWSTPMASAPAVILTPIAASSSIDCQLTTPATTTGFTGRCWTAQTTTLNLGIITAGLSLNPMTATVAGVQVQVIALPQTQ